MAPEGQGLFSPSSGSSDSIEQTSVRLGGFVFEETPEGSRTPADVNARFAINSQLRLRRAVINLIKDRTQERKERTIRPRHAQSDRTPPPPYTRSPTRTYTISVEQSLERVPSDSECREFGEFVSDKFKSGESIHEVELVEIRRGSPTFLVSGSTDHLGAMLCRVEWIFHVVR